MQEQVEPDYQTQPHEYDGIDTDIGVGYEWSPCTLCGRPKDDECHVHIPMAQPTIEVEEIPF
jgi:hypothetical protein